MLPGSPGFPRAFRFISNKMSALEPTGNFLMLKKARVSMEIHSPAVFFRPEMGKAQVEGSITLQEFSIKNNAISWVMEDDKGRLIQGGAKDKQVMPIYPGAWVILSMPVMVHVFQNICPEFVFCIPASRRVLTERKFQEEFRESHYNR